MLWSSTTYYVFLIMQKSRFHSYVRVPPLNLLRLKPEIYMFLVGLTELVCVGLIILYGRSRIGVLTTWMLALIMVGALYTHFMVGDDIADMGGALFGLAFVLTRLTTMGELKKMDIKIKLK